MSLIGTLMDDEFDNPPGTTGLGIDCTCICHRMPNVFHCMPCCTPKVLVAVKPEQAPPKILSDSTDGIHPPSLKDYCEERKRMQCICATMHNGGDLKTWTCPTHGKMEVD